MSVAFAVASFQGEIVIAAEIDLVIRQITPSSSTSRSRSRSGSTTAIIVSHLESLLVGRDFLIGKQLLRLEDRLQLPETPQEMQVTSESLPRVVKRVAHFEQSRFVPHSGFTMCRLPSLFQVRCEYTAK